VFARPRARRHAVNGRLIGENLRHREPATIERVRHAGEIHAPDAVTLGARRRDRLVTPRFEPLHPADERPGWLASVTTPSRTCVRRWNKSTQRSAKTLKKQIDNFIAEWPNLNENQKTAFVKEYKDELAELLEWVEASGEEVEDEAAQREGAVA